jgi:hypothetical protein
VSPAVAAPSKPELWPSRAELGSCLLILGFELRALHLLSRWSAISFTPPALFCFSRSCPGPASDPSPLACALLHSWDCICALPCPVHLMRWGLANFLFRLVSKCYPPNLYLQAGILGVTYSTWPTHLHLGFPPAPPHIPIPHPCCSPGPFPNRSLTQILLPFGPKVDQLKCSLEGLARPSEEASHPVLQSSSSQA